MLFVLGLQSCMLHAEVLVYLWTMKSAKKMNSDDPYARLRFLIEIERIEKQRCNKVENTCAQC